MLITDSKELKRFEACHRIWQGIPSIARTKKGRTFLSLYSGATSETYGNYCFVIQSENGRDFGEPIVAAEKMGKYRCYDPCIWIDPLERLWFIWSVMPGEEVWGAICENPDAETLSWGKEFYIGRGIMINKPTVLSTGEWLFPIALWHYGLKNEMRRDSLLISDVPASYVYKTSDCGKTFIRLGGADIPKRSFDEHMILEQNNGVLRMLVRRADGIGESYSYDRGKTWSKGQKSELEGPCSRFFFGRLRSGRVLLINHYDFHGRNNLTAMLSEDDGKTFPYRLLLDERFDVAYPDAMECDDGFIYITYDRERGDGRSSLEQAYADAREVFTAKISEQDILNGTLTNPESFLKNIASKLGKLADGDPDPYLSLTVDEYEMAVTLIEEGEKDPVRVILEKYPIHCSNLVDVDAKQLDALIVRFRSSENKDADALADIIRFVRHAPTKPKETFPIVAQAQKKISESIAGDFSVGRLAEELKVSQYYLSHLFKSVTGITMLEYRNELRLTKAKNLLIATDQSINEIAQALGFCTAAYFSELFVKSEKISPSEYRKLHQ